MTYEMESERPAVGTSLTADHDRRELKEDELARVIGGADGPGSPTDGTAKASPRLF